MGISGVITTLDHAGGKLDLSDPAEAEGLMSKGQHD